MKKIVAQWINTVEAGGQTIIKQEIFIRATDPVSQKSVDIELTEAEAGALVYRLTEMLDMSYPERLKS